MYKKHTEKEWAKAFELYKQGFGSKRIGKETGIPHACVSRRICQFNISGEWRTTKKFYVRSSPALKTSAVDAVLSNRLSYVEATLKYGISFSCLDSWLRKYRHGGYEELLATKPKGRSPKMPKKKKKPKEMTELERLQEEVAYLRAENDYLKKLKALDQEENAEMFGIGPRQSED